MKQDASKRSIYGGKLYPSVNVQDDYSMVREGLRPPVLSINRNTFYKNTEEKALLKKVRNSQKFASKICKGNDYRFKGKLVVYAKQQGSTVKQFKSTQSFLVNEKQVNEIVSFLKKEGYNITKIYFNNKLYQL